MKMRKLVCTHKYRRHNREGVPVTVGPAFNSIVQPVAQTLTHWFFKEYPDVPFDKENFVDLINDFDLMSYTNKLS